MGVAGSRDHLLGSNFANQRISIPYSAVRASIVRSAQIKQKHSVVPAYRLYGIDGAKQRGLQPWSAVNVPYPVYGRSRNHCAILNPEILEYFIPFVLALSLPTLLQTCRHWFITLHDFILERWCSRIIRDFQTNYKSVLLLEKATISMQPLYTEDFAVRCDLLLFAKVLNQAKHKCVQVAATYKNIGPRRQAVSKDENAENHVRMYPTDGPVPPPSAPLRHKMSYRMEVKPYNAQRTIWLRRDSTRFHGDEICVVASASVPTVCVHDRVEIPVNLANAVGALDPVSFQWSPLEFITDKHDPPRSYGQKCTLDDEPHQWYDFDTFQAQAPDRLTKFDFFKPQWRVKTAEYTGLSLVISRTTYAVEALGDVEAAAQGLGLQFKVVKEGCPIVIPLKRLGLEHDRFADQQIRRGDTVKLYVVQGGPEAP